MDVDVSSPGQLWVVNCLSVVDSTTDCALLCQNLNPNRPLVIENYQKYAFFGLKTQLADI